MKLIFLTTACFLFCISNAVSQSAIRWELSLSGNVGSSTEHVDQSGTSTLPSEVTSKYFSLTVRVGRLINGPLELEPEILWTARKGRSPSYAVAGNFSYNIVLSRSDRIILFPLVGYGFARGIPAQGNITDTAGTKPKLSLFNVGAGLKMLVTDNVGIRLEYRYQQYKGTLPQTSSPYTSSFDSLFFGFSFFF